MIIKRLYYNIHMIILLSLLSLFLLLPSVFSVQVVEVPQQQTPTETSSGGFGSYFAFLKNGYFWLIIAGLILLLLFVIGIFFLVRWLVKYIKQRNDIYYLMKEERWTLARIHRRYNSKHWYKTEKNTPIRLARKDEHGKIYISNPIGYHRGDYVTHEGNMIISLNLVGKKQYFILPYKDILVIPNKEKISITQRDDKGEVTKKIDFDLPIAKDIVQFNENEILLFAESISAVGMFLIPVLKSSDGKIIDLSMPIYQSIKDVVLGEYLYHQSQDYVSLSRKAVEQNPFVRIATKMADSNQSVEVGSQNNQNNQQ